VPVDPPDRAAVIVSSGRGVHEAIAAASICRSRAVSVRVIDMPSIDEALLIRLCQSEELICLAEHNNGYILQNLLKIVYRQCPDVATSALQRILPINTLDADGRPRFIHSGTYEELIAAFGLEPAQIANAVIDRLAQRPVRRSASREGGGSE
jgi:transketolase C-terminal domain/subunit